MNMGYKSAARYMERGRHRDHGSSPERESGQEHELDVLGVPFTGQDLKKYRRYEEQNSERDGYILYYKAVRGIRKFYPENKEIIPEKDFTRDLRIEVMDRLSVHPDWEDDVKIYSALGTKLDKRHSIDGWIELPNSVGHPIMVTLDATINRQKIEGGYKADIFVDEMPDPESDEFLEYIRHYGGLVEDKLKAKMDIAHLQQPKEADAELEEVAAAA